MTDRKIVIERNVIKFEEEIDSDLKFRRGFRKKNKLEEKKEEERKNKKREKRKI